MPRASTGQERRDCSNGDSPRVPHTAHTARHATPGLQERDELALGLRIPLDVALRRGETGMGLQALLEVNLRLATIDHVSNGYDVL